MKIFDKSVSLRDLILEKVEGIFPSIEILYSWEKYCRIGIQGEPLTERYFFGLLSHQVPQEDVYIVIDGHKVDIVRSLPINILNAIYDAIKEFERLSGYEVSVYMVDSFDHFNLPSDILW